MKIDPFTNEEYQGKIVQGTCDGCGEPCSYEEDAYGQTTLVLCGITECKAENLRSEYEDFAKS